MILENLWRSLEASSLGTYVASSDWAFPTLETIHVMAIVTVVGTVAIMDLRLLGLASGKTKVTAMSRETLPLTWGAFILAVISGSLLFVSKATSYAVNPYFQFKMAFMFLAGVNMALFHVVTWRDVAKWDKAISLPTAAKWAGGLSIALWMCVVFCARVVGFTLGIYSM